MTNRLERFLEIVKKEEENRKDIILPYQALTMYDDGKIFSDDLGEVKIGEEALDQLCRNFGFSKRHMDLLISEERQDLVANQFNHFFKKSNKEENIQLRVVNDRLKGVVSSKYKPFNDYQLFNLVNEVKEDFPQADLQSIWRDDKRTHARFILSERDITVGDGSIEDGNKDIVKIGFDVSNSEIGYSSIHVVPVTYRLVCSNGLIAFVQDKEKRFKQKHMGFDIKNITEQIREGIAVAIKEAEYSTVKMIKSRNFLIEDPYRELEYLTQRERFTKQQSNRIKEIYEIEPQKNLFAIIQAFTRFGRELEEKNKNNELRVKVEEFAGTLLERVN